MLKKIITFLFLICISIESLTAYAKSDLSIKSGKEFIEYKEDKSKSICEILKISEEQMNSYLKDNKIVYFAINKSNTKQISISEESTEFSQKITNLSFLPDNQINELMSEIIESKDSYGKIIVNNNQKFIKTILSSNDSGGDYSIIQYTTFAGKKKYVLSFLTSTKEDTAYSDEIFKSLSSDSFQTANKKSPLYILIPIIIILLSVFSAYIIFSIFKDRKKDT